MFRQPKPVYPQPAKQVRIQGVVRLHALISREGTIENLQVVSGHPLLVPSTLEAVKQWAYQPTLLNGEPVEVETDIDGNFTLSELARLSSQSAYTNASPQQPKRS